MEIAENLNGVLRLLLKDTWDWDILLNNEKDMVVGEHYGINFVVSGKIADFHFSKEFLWKIVHYIDHRSVIISGKDGSEKTLSEVKWVL